MKSDFKSLLFRSPIGILEIKGNQTCIFEVHFTEVEKVTDSTDLPTEVILKCAHQLDEYFKGMRKTFNIPLKTIGTPFQKQVWDQLLNIPYGHTAAYSEIAEAVANPKAVRAVGGANHNNPISIIIPCHRIIGKDGSLTGYGGGLWRKEWLLVHERNHN